ncbi:hypothetical protein HY570_01625, partial [Candidatus Micrarchaeota archaeon]|nr:hypothetical protein [Candidatus Micrarchaeota archaeon]
DHNYLEKKQEQLLDNFFILYGTEISTAEGHVSIFGVKKEYKRGIPAQDLIDKVNDENGVSVITHPFAIRKSSLGKLALKINATALEKFNGSDFIHNLLALKYIKNGTGGSDAHTWDEIGNAYTLIDAELNKDSILDALRKGIFKPVYSCNYFSLMKRYLNSSRNKKR